MAKGGETYLSRRLGAVGRARAKAGGGAAGRAAGRAAGSRLERAGVRARR